MSPWDILGWLLLAFFLFSVVVPILIRILVKALEAAGVAFRHLKTYRTPPAIGQRWHQKGHILKVTGITENGRIVVKSGGAYSSVSWSDTPEMWKRRRSQWSFYLESDQ